MLPRVRFLLVVLLGLVYTVASVIVGLAIAAAGILRCSEGCEYVTNWTADQSAWQWYVVFALGPISLLFGLAVLGLAVAVERSMPAFVALALHASALVAAAGLLLQSPEVGRGDVVFWLPLTLGSGLGLVYARRASRQSAGTRLE
jgi:hypothetical protein